MDKEQNDIGTRIGLAAAEAMESIDKDFPDGYRVGTVAVVVEVDYVIDEKRSGNTIMVASDEMRTWVRKAFLTAAADMHPGLGDFHQMNGEEESE